RRSSIATVMNYRLNRASPYDVKMLQDDDPEYDLVDFVAGGRFSPGASELEVILPISLVNELLPTAPGTAHADYAKLIGQSITSFQRKYSTSGQVISWTPINLKIAGLVLYAEGGGPVMYLPQKTILALDNYVIDKKGEVALPLKGTPWTGADLY